MTAAPEPDARGAPHRPPRSMAVLGALLLALLVAAAAPPSTKETRMAETNVTRSLAALGPNDDKGFTALARSIAAKSDGDVRELISVLHGKDEIEARKAAAVLLELRLLAFAALADSVKKDDPSQAVWDAQVLGDILLDSRGRLVAVLDSMLDDRRDHPMPEFKGLEEKHPPRRVCDEAYLLERRLLFSNEAEDQAYANARAFLALPPAERDKEIAKARATRTFKNFAEE
jgi:hypothetical protein